MPLAAPGGSFGVGLGAFGLACPADQVLGAVGDQEVGQLWPAHEAEAFDQSGGAGAEEGGAANGSGWQSSADGLVGSVGLGAGDVEAAGAVASGADALDGVVGQVRGAFVSDRADLAVGVDDQRGVGQREVVELVVALSDRDNGGGRAVGVGEIAGVLVEASGGGDGAGERVVEWCVAP